MRAVLHRYEDPLDRVWVECAARVGLRVVPSDDAYATTDGRGTLALAHGAALDADDSLAQMIFHELCHALVQGAEAFSLIDWGLDNQNPRDLLAEHACLRLQAQLAGRYGLRGVLAPTTDARPFYDALPDEPFEDDETSRRARLGAARISRPPFGPHVEQALVATEQIVRAAAPFAAGSQSLFARVAARPQPHPSGFSMRSDETCGSCAWRSATGRCVQSSVRVAAELTACERWQRAGLDCQQCGACCREGYDTVEIGPRDPVRAHHPELVVVRDGRLNIAREGVRCAALTGGCGGEAFACRIYDHRPKPCRDLAPGTQNCLIARRRVGLSS